MTLTIRITKLLDEGKIKAFATVGIEGVFLITGIKVIDGKNGLFVAMPSKRIAKTGDYKDICFPMTKEYRTKISDLILNEYKKRMEEDLL